MLLINFCRIGILQRGSSYMRCQCLSTAKENLVKLLRISDSKAEYICMKYPLVRKIDLERMKSSLHTITELGFSKKILLEDPTLFSILPVTLKYRYKVLEECGIVKITCQELLSYLTIVKQKTIGQLKQSHYLQSFVNIENKLASFMTQWPTSLTTSISGDIDKLSLYSIRLKIIQRYLELVLDLSYDEFYRAIETYPTIKHRPLQSINSTLNILQAVIMMPNQKIRNNMYLVHADPDNLNNIIFKINSIGGIDMKEVIRLHPKIAARSYSSIIEIRNILEEYNISNEAQRRCFDIYTLGPNTVRERLKQAKEIPEFNTFYKHPRFLKIIHYKNTALKRMWNLYNSNKKCLSLNILSGSTAHFETFEKAPGDRLGKGKDLIFCISQSLNKAYSSNEIRKLIKRHPFWINTPLVQVKFVHKQLSKDFTDSDIFQNCCILLYPWNKIKEILNLINSRKINKEHIHDSLDINKLDNSQKLSLVLYLLEKNHYFTGNGVWLDEKRSNNEPAHTKA